MLVSVTDITDRVVLGEELDRAKGDGTQQAEQLLDLLLGLMKLDSGILESRLTRWQGLLNEANNALRNADRLPSGELRDTLVFSLIDTDDRVQAILSESRA